MSRPAERPVRITDVGESPEEEYQRRRRRYGAMMLGRVVCILAAFVIGSVFHNIFLALICVLGAAVLPWAAVLIANDRLPKAERQRMAERRAQAGAGLTALTKTGSEPQDRPRPPADDAPPRVIEG